MSDSKKQSNKVFIATSFDGYIADENGGIEWLTQIPTPSDSDGGFSQFMESVDALIMGRNTFEKVLSFGIEWPYSKKVFVWTSQLKTVPDNLKNKVELVSGPTNKILQLVNNQGFNRLYIDGGKSIQSFMQEGLINEIVVTLAPIILGKGIPLFHNFPKTNLLLKQLNKFDNGMVQINYEIRN